MQIEKIRSLVKERSKCDLNHTYTCFFIFRIYRWWHNNIMCFANALFQAGNIFALRHVFKRLGFCMTFHYRLFEHLACLKYFLLRAL